MSKVAVLGGLAPILSVLAKPPAVPLSGRNDKIPLAIDKVASVMLYLSP